jgi:hypothetical protein
MPYQRSFIFGKTISDEKSNEIRHFHISFRQSSAARNSAVICASVLAKRIPRKKRTQSMLCGVRTRPPVRRNLRNRKTAEQTHSRKTKQHQ